MKSKKKQSKLSTVLSSLLVVFVCLLSFSIGVITGKDWSDTNHEIQFIENDSHVHAANQDSAPIGDEMTTKEVELLTQRAMAEAKAAKPTVEEAKPETALDQMVQQVEANENKDSPTVRSVASNNESDEENDESEIQENEPKGREAATAKAPAKKAERKVSSLPPQSITIQRSVVDFTVQVASYRTLDEAERHSQKLIDKGFPAFPIKAMVDGELWYRVTIGSFKTLKAAKRYEQQLKKQAVVKSTFVQKIKRLEK